MSLQDLGNIGEFLAAVAVLVSLVYLAVQIRQNTRSVRMASQHAICTSLHELSQAMVYEPSLPELLRVGGLDLNSLGDDDRMRFETIVSWLFRMYEEIYTYHQQGHIESNFWTARSENMLAYISIPGVRQWWDTLQLTFPRTGAEQFSQEFREYMAKKLGEE